VGPDREDLFAALVTLREATDRSAPAHAAAWRTVDTWLGSNLVRSDDDRHREAYQKTLIRVLRSVGTMKADAAPAAESWLRRVYAHNLTDEHRRHARDPVTKGLRTVATGDDDERLLDWAGPLAGEVADGA